MVNHLMAEGNQAEFQNISAATVLETEAPGRRSPTAQQTRQTGSRRPLGASEAPLRRHHGDSPSWATEQCLWTSLLLSCFVTGGSGRVTAKAWEEVP